MVNNIDVKILKSRTRAIWYIDALPTRDQYLDREEHQRNKSWRFLLNDKCFIPTRSTMSSQYFCSAAVFCYRVSLSEYWRSASIISNWFDIIEAGVNQRCTAHLVTSCIMSIHNVTITKNLLWPYVTMINTPIQTHNLTLALLLSKTGQNSKEVRCAIIDSG